MADQRPPLPDDEHVTDDDPAATPDATTDAEGRPAEVDDQAPGEAMPERRYDGRPPTRSRLPGVHTRAALTMPAAEVGAALGAEGIRTTATQPLTVRVGEAGTDDDGGTFEGYACVWGVTDAYGTQFARGCFSAGGLDEEPYALLWMHDPWQVLGIFTATEDDHGLLIAGRWDRTREGQDARAKADSGSAAELSVGFVPVMVDPDDDQVFTAARLVETSQITRRMAAVPGAAITGSRGPLPKGRPGDDPAAAGTAAADAAAAAARVALLLTEVPVTR